MLQSGSPTGSFLSIAGLVSNNAQEPDTKGCTQTKLAQAVVSLKEGVLRRILGFCRLACDQIRDSIHKLLIAPHERLESSNVATAREVDKLGILQ